MVARLLKEYRYGISGLLWNGGEDERRKVVGMPMRQPDVVNAVIVVERSKGDQIPAIVEYPTVGPWSGEEPHTVLFYYEGRHDSPN